MGYADAPGLIRVLGSLDEVHLVGVPRLNDLLRKVASFVR